VTNTVACLDAQVAPAWHETVQALRPGLSYLALYLGFNGDIAAAGATAANVWIYESEGIGRLWLAPADEDAPGLFVSFPSLKDPATKGKHTAEVVALCDARVFGPWLHLPVGERPEEYVALKAWIEQRMVAQFRRHFPALAPMLEFHEPSTPVTQRHFVRSPDGAMYGLEMSARRLGSDALDIRTPVPAKLPFEAIAELETAPPRPTGSLSGRDLPVDQNTAAGCNAATAAHRRTRTNVSRHLAVSLSKTCCSFSCDLREPQVLRRCRWSKVTRVPCQDAST